MRVLDPVPGYAINVKFFTLFLIAVLAEAAPLILRNINIVDTDSGTIQKNRNVVITGPLITSVTAGTERPSKPALPKGRGGFSGNRAIDGSGKYLITGLWDMHVHLWEKKPMLGRYVANGVLGIRDMGSDLAQTKSLRADIQAGHRIGPRIFTSGSPVNGPGPDNPKMQVVRTVGPDSARRMVDALDAQGADFIDVLSTLPKDAYFALAQRARVIRAVFAGHVPDSVTVSQAIDSRQKSMEHLFGIALACSSEEPELREARYLAMDTNDTAELVRIRARTYETFNEPRAIELFRKMARYDVWQTPTLILRKRISPEDYDFHARLVYLMQKNGVGLLAGTDTGDDGVHPGEALHQELELLVKAGLTPAQALRTATYNPAQYFGIDAQSIAKGKRADLVLLNANPLDDIRNTRNINSVIVQGRLLDRKQLGRLAKENDATWSETSPSSKQTPARSSAKRQGSSRKPVSRTR